MRTEWLSHIFGGEMCKHNETDEKVGCRAFHRQHEKMADFSAQKRSASIAVSKYNACSESADHFGLVEYIQDNYVHTIKGNSGNVVRQNSYPIGTTDILGYGIPYYW